MGGITPWVSQLNPVQDGEQVNAVVTNRLPDQIAQRAQHNKDVLDSMQAGEALYRRGVALSTDTLVGSVVYFDKITTQYRKAIAAVVFDPLLNGYKVADSSYAVGIVVSKSISTRGDILTLGYLGSFDFTNTIGSSGATAAEGGAYYLSAMQPGMLTKQKPPVGVFIAFLNGDSSAQFQPTPREILDDHIHYSFQLYSLPAGVLADTSPDEAYNFISTDPTKPGWLPANDPSFGGVAPVGAKFGYNLKEHPELARVWPPMPIDGGYLEADGKGVLPSAYVIDMNGLWWFDNCYSKAPWPTLIETSSSSSSSSGGTTCDSGPTLEQIGFQYADPRYKYMRLYFTKMVWKTNSATVTRLQPAAGSPITVTNCQGNPATTGALQLGLNLAMSVVPGGTGYQAVTNIVGQEFRTSPIVEGLVPGSFITLTPVPGYGVTDEAGVTRGRIVIAATPPNSDAEGRVSLAALNGVLEDQQNGVFYLNLPQGENTSLIGRIDVSQDLAIVNPVLELWFWVLAVATGILPNLQLGYKRMPRPDPVTSPVAIPIVDTPMPDLDFTAYGSVPVNKYIEIPATPVAIASGDVFFFTLRRPGTDSFGGDVGLLQLGYRIISA